MGLDTLQNGLATTIGTIKADPAKTALAVGAGAAFVGGAVGLAVASRKRSNKRKKRRPIKHSRKKTRRSRYKRRRTPRTAGKRKDYSTKRIRYTKRGQPYIILKNGKARFIKSSSARRSHKMKGGRY